MLALTLLPVATGVVAGIAAVSLAFGSVHGITLGFGATLLGEGVDYAIYLFTSSVPGALSPSGSRWLWRTLRLGVLTSVVGFGVMLLSDFSGLAQLGLFSITGLLVAFGVTRWVLPQLMPEGYRVQPFFALASALLRAVRLAPAARGLVLVLVVACALVLAVRGGKIWDDRLESLSPIPEVEKRTYAQLQSDLGTPDARYLVVISPTGEQSALEQAEQAGAVLDRLVANGALSAFESPARILPSEATQLQRQRALPPEATLRSNLKQAVRGTQFKAESFEPFLRAVAEARQAPLLRRADLANTALNVRLESLLTQQHDVWVAMLSLGGVQDVRPITVALDGLHLSSLHLLDIKRETEELYRSYRAQAVALALGGAGAIVLLLLVALRSPRRVYAVLAPLLAALIVTSTALTVGAHQLTMFHLIGLLLVVGVGSNYTLFFEPRTFAAGDAERTAASVTLCNICTVIGFGLLGLAEAPVLRFIGSTVALGAFLSLVFAAVLSEQ
jgi:predicted exporter